MYSRTALKLPCFSGFVPVGEMVMKNGVLTFKP